MPHNTFAALHTPASPLILYNIWNATTAQAAERAGAKAVATGSWSLAAAHGYEDGQVIPFSLLLDIVRRITASVAIPVSVDFERGYADTQGGISDSFAALLDAGVVGINIEDQNLETGGIHSLTYQTALLRRLRATADTRDIPAFINARTDLFLQAPDTGTHVGLLDHAVERARAYRDAGASDFFALGIFDLGLSDITLITRLCNRLDMPVNIMALKISF